MANFTARNHLNSAGVKFGRLKMPQWRWVRIMQLAQFDEESIRAGIRGYESGCSRRLFDSLGFTTRG